jgi:dihydrofolate synthase/folylpolyglutamate synthase
VADNKDASTSPGKKLRFSRLDEWLRWQESLHDKEIDLGLDRVNQVFIRLGIKSLAKKVITVAGTNGKGSCVAFLEKLYLAAGYQAGSYTSPHLLRYNERINIAGQPVADDALFDAFEAVDQARGDISLTYFEFGTLAAFYLFAQQVLDIVILEVGMGGRLDATNIIDADGALITAIGLDHQAWLGTNREDIAREKAGILRPGQIAVCGDRQPPASLIDTANKLLAKLVCLGQGFDYTVFDSHWQWSGAGLIFSELPLPMVPVQAQFENISAALQMAVLLQAEMPFTAAHLLEALTNYVLPGRCQLVAQSPEVWLDVAHNPQAIKVLVDTLAGLPGRLTHFVIGIMADKDVAGIIDTLAAINGHWYVAAPQCARALKVQTLCEIVTVHNPLSVNRFGSIAEAYTHAMQNAGSSGRVVVAGSFYTVAEVMAERRSKRL